MAIESPEHIIVVDLDAFFELVVFGDSVSGASDFVFEQVRQCDDLYAGVGLKALTQCAVSSSATTQQTDFNFP